VDPAGELLGEDKRGEIVVSGTNVCEGYFADAAETARVFRDGALHTGDVGYLAQGQLFVTGRVKDVVIVNGRNYDPTHIERIAMRVAGVRLAAAVSWQVDGAESLLIAIEQAGNQGDVPEAVRAAVAAELGLEPRHVLAFAPGSLPRTTSGKLMRSAAQQLCKARLS
jgi:fatty-acyl-CoA synthase